MLLIPKPTRKRLFSNSRVSIIHLLMDLSPINIIHFPKTIVENGISTRNCFLSSNCYQIKRL